jgi:hypothetical protein
MNFLLNGITLNLILTIIKNTKMKQIFRLLLVTLYIGVNFSCDTNNVQFKQNTATQNPERWLLQTIGLTVMMKCF